MDNINFVKILEFIENNAGKSYKSIDKAENQEERVRIENIKIEANEMLKEWKKLYPHFTAMGYEYNNKSVSQWLNGSNTQVKSYLWLALKKKGFNHLSSSISVFAEKIQEEVRFRVTIEIDDKNSSREDYIRHNRFLDKFGEHVKSFNVFASIGDGLDIRELREDEIYNYIEAVKRRDERKVQVGKLFSKDDVLKLGNDKFLNELDNTVNLLEPYYDACIEELNENIISNTDGGASNNQLNSTGSTIMNLKYIKTIESYLMNKGFIYSQNSLSNFYLSLKTKPFVILAGISGTGKSKLVKLFAEAIGATAKNGQYNLISVKPDWNDSTELLGYKNIKDEFVPGKLLQIIQEAQRDENKNKPYFVCLDEMNLARVEYYLSEYLSIIESREINDGGEIVTDVIFSNKYLGDSEENEEYRGLFFPENLYIVGTVNMDDTTFSFSRKVLDRANTIEFSDVDLELLEFNEGDSEIVQVDNSFLRTRCLSIKDALKANEEYVKEVNEKIIQINDILKPYSKHFAYRVRDEIVFYMLENKLSELLKEDEAFDYQIKQKILPTIIGSDECIKDILFKLYKYCVPEVDLNPDGDYVKQASEYLVKAKYKQSAEKISMMLRGYRDGYTSFWI